MAKEKANELMIPAEPGKYSVVFDNMQTVDLDIKYIFDNAFVGYDEKGNEIIVIKSKITALIRHVEAEQPTVKGDGQ